MRGSGSSGSFGSSVNFDTTAFASSSVVEVYEDVVTYQVIDIDRHEQEMFDIYKTAFQTRDVKKQGLPVVGWVILGVCLTLQAAAILGMCLSRPPVVDALANSSTVFTTSATIKYGKRLIVEE